MSLQDRVESIQEKVSQASGRKYQIEDDLKTNREKHTEATKDLELTRKAQKVIQLVAQETQEQLQFQISDLVTLALSSVFGEEMEFGVEFVLKRNKSEAELFFIKNGERVNPMDEAGGGVIDIASFALRVCMWGLQSPRSRNVLILDEPFKHLSRDLVIKAGETLQKISEKLNLQIIIISHEKRIIQCANKVFRVTQVDGISKVTEE